MPKDDQLFFPADLQRQRLLEKKLGDLLTWKKPELVRTIGPFDPTAFDPFDAQRRELMASCVDRLRSLTDEQIAIITEGGDSSHGSEWRRYLWDEISRLQSQKPQEYLGGLGHPDHIADFTYWAKMPRFSVAELTCLTAGIGPDEYDGKRLKDLATSKDRSRLLPAVEFLVKRYEQLDRKFAFYRGGKNIPPLEFLAWAEQVEFEVHSGFLEPLKRFHAAKEVDAPQTSPGKQDKREVDSISKLLAAVAIEEFGYAPHDTRSPIPKELSDIAARIGLSISDETVLKYLRRGASFVSQDWKPHKR